MKKTHYSDEEFQDYFDGCLAADADELKDHLRDCESCRQNFEAYSAVWTFFQYDLQAPALRIDLAHSVTEVFRTKERNTHLEKIIYGTFAALCIAGIIWCCSHLVSLSPSGAVALLTIPFVVYVLLTYKEVQLIRRRFSAG